MSVSPLSLGSATYIFLTEMWFPYGTLGGIIFPTPALPAGTVHFVGTSCWLLIVSRDMWFGGQPGPLAIYSGTSSATPARPWVAGTPLGQSEGPVYASTTFDTGSPTVVTISPKIDIVVPVTPTSKAPVFFTDSSPKYTVEYTDIAYLPNAGS